LTSIQGFGQAIADGTARGGESLERAGQVIVQEAARLGRLVDDLLALTRFDAGQAMIDRRLIDPATVLAAAHERMQIAAAEQGVELSLTAKPLPPLPADPDRLLQVMTNLIANAIQHTARGGRILVAGQADAEWLRLTVEDNGPGIAPEHLPRIFERFYRADPARPAAAGRGSGLGLAIAEEIVRAHGGRVDVWSQPGVGSRFTVVLPLAPEAASTISARRR
jgi:signal transduction histidine kinase